MILENYYYYFIDCIPPRICDEIVQFGQGLQEDFATTGQISAKEAEEKQEEIKLHRDSNVSWISEPWVYSEIHPLVDEANRNAKWNFDWDFSEPAQFTRYKLNQYYHWHADQDVQPFTNDNVNYHGKIRKLSCTLQLSHPGEYEGGDLEFETPNGVFQVNEIKERGSICIFPSFVKHRVTPVTKGVRHSLVIWNLGYPYK